MSKNINKHHIVIGFTSGAGKQVRTLSNNKAKKFLTLNKRKFKLFASRLSDKDAMVGSENR